MYKDYQKMTNFKPIYGDLTDSTNIIRILKKVQPDEIYNLGAQSHVHTSFETPEYTSNTNALGPLRILEAIRLLNLQSKTKFYQASTSEIFGNAKSPQSEKTNFLPESPYGTSKLFELLDYKITEKHIIFLHVMEYCLTHESPRRGETFVTRKITRAIAEIYLKKRDMFYIGN